MDGSGGYKDDTPLLQGLRRGGGSRKALREQIRMIVVVIIDAVKDKHMTYEMMGDQGRATAKGDRFQVSNTQTKKRDDHPTPFATTSEHGRSRKPVKGTGIDVTHTGWLDFPNEQGTSGAGTAVAAEATALRKHSLRR